MYTIVAAAILALYLLQRWLKFLTPKGIPGMPAYPDPYPILGDVPRMAAHIKKHRKFSHLFDQMGRDLGPISQLKLPSGKVMVVVNDYATNMTILNSPHFDRSRVTGQVFDNIVPTGQIAIPSNDMWKRHRRAMAPAMSAKSLEMMTPRVLSTVRELVELCEAKRLKADGRPWEIADDFVSAAMDIINGMAFGETWGIIKHATRQVQNGRIAPTGEAVFDAKRPDIAAAAIYLLESVLGTSSYPAIDLLLQRWSPHHRRQYNLVNRFLRSKLAESRARTSKDDYDPVMADNTLDMISSRGMPDNEMIDEIFLYLVAGTETSAVTLAWYAKFMTNHPNVQRKLRAHLLERIPEVQDRDMTFQDVDPGNVPYLEAVVQETLRLGRITSGVARDGRWLVDQAHVVREDTVLHGYRIPKGSIVMSSAGVHYEDETFGSLGDKRRVGYWKAGTTRQFIPERWLREDWSFDADAGPTMPFSSGPRGCLGKNLALLELRMVISHMTLAFFLAPLEDRFNSQEAYETITIHPVQSFVKLEKW